MILKGSQRGGARNLARHLMNRRDNDHVDLREVRGFVASDLLGAFEEAEAISKGTQARQFLFSLSVNPPAAHTASEKEFEDVIDRAEQILGLDGHPRATVIHEKEGRRHAHAVWSRIDADQMKAVNLPHFKRRLTSLSRALFLEHGWTLPGGLKTNGGKSPLNFTLAEWQQAKRIGLDPREVKQVFREAWEVSDTLTGLQNALGERGYALAKGDRRGFVALDVEGNVYAFPRWAGLKSKEVRDRLGAPVDLPSVAQTKADLRTRLRRQFKGYITDVRTKQRADMAPLNEERRDLVDRHRSERIRLTEGQAKRWAEEQRLRMARLNTGIRGFWDRVTGKASTTREENERQAVAAARRDQSQRDDLVRAQMRDRRQLQDRIDTLRKRQAKDRALLARSIAASLERQRHAAQEPEPARERGRGKGRSLER